MTLRPARLCMVLLILAVTGPGAGSTRAAAATWDAARLTEPLRVDGLALPYPEFAIFLLPGQRFEVGFANAAATGSYRFGDAAGTVGGPAVAGAVTALAAPPTPGHYTLEIDNPAAAERALIHVFTLVPARQVGADGRLNGYRIGAYPATPLRGLAIYRPPAGFVEVTAANEDVRVSPNFRLGQFVSKQEHGYPRYLVLRVELLMKLESILAALNRSGRPTGGLTVMSGFRTPFYNRAIGNVPYSRHVWGGAADIFVDEAPADGRMDDLNGDGMSDVGDARWLAAFVDDLSKRGVFGPRIGGLGIYGSNAAHGPFIHVDVRGTRARW